MIHPWLSCYSQNGFNIYKAPSSDLPKGPKTRFYYVPIKDHSKYGLHFSKRGSWTITFNLPIGHGRRYTIHCHTHQIKLIERLGYRKLAMPEARSSTEASVEAFSKFTSTLSTCAGKGPPQTSYQRPMAWFLKHFFRKSRWSFSWSWCRF